MSSCIPVDKDGEVPYGLECDLMDDRGGRHYEGRPEQNAASYCFS